MTNVPPPVDLTDSPARATRLDPPGPAAQPGSGAGAPSDGTVAVAQRCVQLGWSMQRLYAARPTTLPTRPGLPRSLPGVAGLHVVERVAIDLGQATTSLRAVARGLGWRDVDEPALEPIAATLDACADGGGREAFRRSVLAAHQRLLIALSGVDVLCGKAYQVGYTLADLCRRDQDRDELLASFAPDELRRLHGWLEDLATALPDHASKSVVASLTWWRNAVYVADDSAGGARRRALLTGVPLQRRGRPDPALPDLGGPIARQGELWRLVLTGDKAARDLLHADDYLAAGRRLVREGRRMVARAVFSAPVPFFLMLAVTTAIGAGVVTVISASGAHGGGRLAAYLLTFAGYAATLGKVVAPRLKSAAVAVEGSLWEAALDASCAQAITLPPVGDTDPKGWSRLPLSGDPAVDVTGVSA